MSFPSGYSLYAFKIYFFQVSNSSTAQFGSINADSMPLASPSKKWAISGTPNMKMA
jgi:hypothetical protein